MGIPGFYGAWLQRKVRPAVQYGLPAYVSSLAFDLNGAIHAARAQIYDNPENDPEVGRALREADPATLQLEMFTRLEIIIMTMVQAAEPQDCLILAVDGVAPGAKQLQQRGRRFRSALESSPSEIFDKNAITPGTDFMRELDNFIRRFLGRRRAELPNKVIYSSHLVPGEGEHKIMDYYRRGQVSDGEAARDGAAHILYGLDADLIMLSLLSPVSNIYLARETVKETVAIDHLKQYLQNLAPNNPYMIDDFVIMMFLIGNDFLPHVPSVQQMEESIEELLNIYQEGQYQLTMDGKAGRRSINWPHAARFFQSVAREEPRLLAESIVRPVQYPSKLLLAAVDQTQQQFDYNVYRDLWYKNALGPRGNPDLTARLLDIIAGYQSTPEQEEEFALVSSEITEIAPVTLPAIERMGIDYIRGMEWVYLYYREGTDAVNADWSYLYYHAPLIRDLAIIAAAANDRYPVRGYTVHTGMLQFNALQQMVAVLPLQSRALIPQELQPLFQDNSVLRDLFPDNFVVELEGVKFDHAGVPIVPFADRHRIYHAVSQYPFSVQRAQLYAPGTEIIMRRSPAEIEVARRRQLAVERKRKFEQQKQFQQSQRGRGRGRGRGDYVPRGRGGRGRGDYVPRGRGGRGRGDYVPRGRGGRGRGNYVPRGRGGRGRGDYSSSGRSDYASGPDYGGYKPSSPIYTSPGYNPSSPTDYAPGGYRPSSPIYTSPGYNPSSPTSRSPTYQIRQTSGPIVRSPDEPVVRAPTQPVVRAPTQPVVRAPTQPVVRAPTTPAKQATFRPNAPVFVPGRGLTEQAPQPGSREYQQQILEERKKEEARRAEARQEWEQQGNLM